MRLIGCGPIGQSSCDFSLPLEYLRELSNLSHLQNQMQIFIKLENKESYAVANRAMKKRPW